MSSRACTPTRIGVTTVPTRAAVEQLEALPIDSLWVGGHVVSPSDMPEVMVQLAALAALTRRVRVGSSILLLPLYPPALIAKQIADLDVVSNGRLILGVGVGGEFEEEFRAVEVPVNGRGRRADEAIELIRRFWTGESITFQGDYFRIENVRIGPTPLQIDGPPIVVAGRGVPAIRRAARLGDGWMPYFYGPERFAQSVQDIQAVASELGRDLAGFEWFAFLSVHVDDDGDLARRTAHASLESNFGVSAGSNAERLILAGTPAEVAGRIQRFIDAGANHLILALRTSGHDPKMAERIFRDVVPRLRLN